MGAAKVTLDSEFLRRRDEPGLKRKAKPERGEIEFASERRKTVYGWFSEGFETVGLMQARELLDAN